MFADLERHLPGQHHQLLSVDENYQRFLYYIYGGVSPGYILVDRKDGVENLVARDYPGLNDAEVRDIEPVEYPARDGKIIPGYLAVPDERFKAPWPTIVLPHGGPYDR